MDLELWDMFPHDHPLLDEETALMNDQAKRMETKEIKKFPNKVRRPMAIIT